MNLERDVDDRYNCANGNGGLCSGKKLNNKDAHNCKNSGGKGYDCANMGKCLKINTALSLNAYNGACYSGT